MFGFVPEALKPPVCSVKKKKPTLLKTSSVVTDWGNIVCIKLRSSSNPLCYLPSPQTPPPPASCRRRSSGCQICREDLLMLNEARCEPSETCVEKSRQNSHESHNGDEDAKENNWAKKRCRLCPRMGLFLVEAGMHNSCLCFVVFPLFLSGTLLICSPTAPG